MQHNIIAVKNTDILQEFNTLSYNHTIQRHIVSSTANKLHIISTNIKNVRNSTLPCVSQAAHLCDRQAQTICSEQEVWPAKRGNQM